MTSVTSRDVELTSENPRTSLIDSLLRTRFPAAMFVSRFDITKLIHVSMSGPGDELVTYDVT